MKSPVPYLTDEQFSALAFPDRVCHCAHADLGVEENPRGSNWGHPVQDWLHDAGVNVPAAWCAAAGFHWMVRAGMDAHRLKELIIYPASTFYLYQWAVSSLRLRKEPKRGRLFVYNKASGGHTGVCLSDGEPFRQISGNTNQDGAREGYIVAERLYHLSHLQQYPRWGFIDLEGLCK